MKEDPNQLLTVKAVADMFGVSRATVLRWIRLGWIPARTTPSKRKLVRRGDLDSFLSPDTRTSDRDQPS